MLTCTGLLAAASQLMTRHLQVHTPCLPTNAKVAACLLPKPTNKLCMHTAVQAVVMLASLLAEQATVLVHLTGSCACHCSLSQGLHAYTMPLEIETGTYMVRCATKHQGRLT